MTVSNLIPELLAPVTKANGGKTTTDQKLTTSNHSHQTNTTVDNRGQNKTAVEYSHSYLTTPSTSSYSNGNYSNQFSNHNPQLFNFNRHWSSSARNGALSSLHTAPNDPINAHVTTTTNSGLDSDEPGNVLDELSALFEDNTAAAAVAMDMQ